MEPQYNDLIKKAYSAFNERDIDKALSTMQPNVQWSKAWEGGYISGHDEIKQYWTRQWTEINPKVVQLRLSQGWVNEAYTDLDELVARIRKAQENKEAVSFAKRLLSIAAVSEMFTFRLMLLLVVAVLA